MDFHRGPSEGVICSPEMGVEDWPTLATAETTQKTALRTRRLRGEKMLGLSSIDIGRPLSTVKLDPHDLEEKALDVIRDVLRQQMPLLDENGNKHLMRDHSLTGRAKKGVVLTIPEGEAR